jgi:hypothetical protein
MSQKRQHTDIQEVSPERKRRCTDMTVATQSEFIGEKKQVQRVAYIRIVSQALTELGHPRLADALAEASGCVCEEPSIVQLRQHIINGAWLPACEAAEACTELTDEQLARVKYELMQQHVLEVCWLLCTA